MIKHSSSARHSSPGTESAHAPQRRGHDESAFNSRSLTNIESMRERWLDSMRCSVTKKEILNYLEAANRERSPWLVFL
jgi:hypothetical protein